MGTMTATTDLSETHMTHEEAQLAIHNAKWQALQAIIDFLDDKLRKLKIEHTGQSTPTDTQTIAYYCSSNSILHVRQELVQQQISVNFDYEQGRASEKKS